ncbi:MAG: hypothetical protein K1X79_02360 [Oligoflexia bacterium]|nr:hypothetical protein [Oligoflexia bacterium]
METTIIPVSGITSGPLLQQLNELCSNALLLEEIVVRWVRPDQSILVSQSRDADEPSLVISFLLKGETMALAQIPVPRVRQMHPKLTPLCEQVVQTDADPGFKPNDEWFDQRNTRLGIFVDEELDTNIAPPEALIELMLSYALASAGFVEIQMFSGAPILKQKASLIRLSLVFLGLEDQQGWYETVLFEKASLKNYLKLRAAPLQ